MLLKTRHIPRIYIVFLLLGIFLFLLQIYLAVHNIKKKKWEAEEEDKYYPDYA